jgi:arsenate reductase
MEQAPLWRRLLAELLGSGFLAAVVIGSGIAAQKLSPGAVGLELLENAAATAVGLYAVILMFGPLSGAHFNPMASFVDAAFGELSWRQAWAYLPAQVAGCSVGAVIANLMFSKAAISISAHHRATPAHLLSEVVATLGLILVIFALARSERGHVVRAAVGAYIGGALAWAVVKALYPGGTPAEAAEVVVPHHLLDVAGAPELSQSYQPSLPAR